MDAMMGYEGLKSTDSSGHVRAGGKDRSSNLDD